MRNIELLAPAKSAEIGIEAIRHGADAVYIGGPGYGARAAAGNSIADIQRLCAFAHIYGAKVYVTINTILYDDELSEVEALIHQLYTAGVDALITQDLALLTLHLPPIPLHASTQMDNCTPERAQFLERAGFSQIVVARELSLEQIRQVHASTSLPLEAFVHGALCVSYSGRCYASEYCFGRSANRGRCAQFCRLSFDLKDADGQTLVADQHLLSLRDMNRSSSLEAMMDAGVSSFKIEGRLKDAAYVKNVTAYYRQKIDEILLRRPEYRRSSFGASRVSFRPQLDKSFNRGFTDYFLASRTPNMWSFSTPKSMGEFVGEVGRVGKRSFVLHGQATLNNGDGLAFINAQGRLEGFRANRVEGQEVFPLTMPALSRGMRIFRNEDRLWENALAKPTAERLIAVRLRLAEVVDGYELSLSPQPSALSAQASAHAAPLCTLHFDEEIVPAAKPQRDNIVRNLSKLGGTPFVAESVEVETLGERFIPASRLSEMRRNIVDAAVESLQRLHLSSRDARRAEDATLRVDKEFGYSANIANRQAADWLKRHGAEHIAPAFELQHPSPSAAGAGQAAVLMTCRHCLRYALGQCPQQTGHRPTWREPLALVLPDGRRFPLRFDCSRCEMQVLMPKA